MRRLKLLTIVVAWFLILPIAARSQSYSVLYNFCTDQNTDGTCTDGNGAGSGLVRDSAGNLYGATFYGGAYGHGTVFKLSSAGVETVLYSFCAATGCPDGYSPVGSLVLDASGSLYGTTYAFAGGTNGVVFKLDNEGHETVLHSFCTGNNSATCADGSQPNPGLVLDPAGNIYGTTHQGGAYGFGTVFKLDSSGHETVLHSFCSVTGGTPGNPIPCVDGEYPTAGVIRDSAGNLYGVTGNGGANGNGEYGYAGGGTIFKLDGEGTETVLYSFCDPERNCPVGEDANPDGILVQDTAGSLYGTANNPGNNSYGTVFKLDTAGNYSRLYGFCSTSGCADGRSPNGGLIVDAAGTLYGTTSYGGDINDSGTVFELDRSGHYTVLHNFGSDSDGGDPFPGLIQDSAGNLYGTTNSGGTHNGGTIFALMGATAGPSQPPPYQFIPLTPCRVADTRSGSGAFGAPELAAGATREFDLPQSGCGIPSTAVAYSLNLTVVPDRTLNYLTLWPSGSAQPTVSTLNSDDGRVKANAAIAFAGAKGGVNVFVSDASNVILDIDGYFVPAGTASALAFYPLAPCRVADTRNPVGALGGPFLAGQTSRSFPVQSSACGIPANAQAYSLNVTAVAHSTLNYLTTWPTGQPQPYVSTLNAPTGAVTANAAIVLAGTSLAGTSGSAGTSGAISLFVSDDADFILDVNGYFAPPAAGGLSLYPVTPCRVLDTRGGQGAFAGVLEVPVKTSACALPAAAQAYVLNATVVSPGALNYLTLWPNGESQPYVSTLNADDGAITSNLAILPTANGTIDAFSSDPTQLILDSSGYFAP